jgi:hypothetical protein
MPVLKNGCKIEALQLSQIDRLERALALYMVVAWRIARLMRLGRTCPELDASLFFDADEIRGAFLLAKKPRPKTPITLNQITRLLLHWADFWAVRAMVNLVRKRSGLACSELWMPHPPYRPFAKTMPDFCIRACV